MKWNSHDVIPLKVAFVNLRRIKFVKMFMEHCTVSIGTFYASFEGVNFYAALFWD